MHDGGRWIAHDVLEASVIDDSPLPDREADALRETREGHSVREIARRLHLAPGTVRNHLSSPALCTRPARPLGTTPRGWRATAAGFDLSPARRGPGASTPFARARTDHGADHAPGSWCGTGR
nr:LuxR C-terminal-related transcriptional regulator [Brachybacterium fresconis]